MRHAVLLLTLFLILVGCSNKQLGTFEGYITDKQNHQILVLESGKPENVKAAYFQIEKSEILDENNKRINEINLKVGQKIRVHHTPDMPASLPTNGDAVKIELLPDEIQGNNPISRNIAVEKALNLAREPGIGLHVVKVQYSEKDEVWEVDVSNYSINGYMQKIFIDAKSGEPVK